MILEDPDMSATLAQNTSTPAWEKGVFFFNIRRGLQDFIVRLKGGTLTSTGDAHFPTV